MNHKAMNMKKGLKRLWIVGSVFWFIFMCIAYRPIDPVFWIYLVISQIVWWTLLYVGFWVARGFIDDNDKKAGF